MDKPSRIFDREREWSDLESFATSPDGNPRIAVVYGRRRQGKSFLLRALAAGHRGLYHQALEEERDPALARIGGLVAADAGLGGTVAYADWRDAFAELVRRAGEDRVIVLDEFPYLAAKSPELPSVIQEAFDAARSEQAPAFRLVLCGSAMSVMSGLLSGQRALRGRVSTELPGATVRLPPGGGVLGHRRSGDGGPRWTPWWAERPAIGRCFPARARSQRRSSSHGCPPGSSAHRAPCSGRPTTC